MIEYILFVLGIILLVFGARYLISGASAMSKRFNVPTLIIGLTIVAFGTSMPELIVNIVSAIDGSTAIAFGNIIGSNIANILLVIGVTAIISPIKIQHSTIWKEIPFALLAVIVLFIFSNYMLIDNININSLTRVSGIILLLFFLIFIYYAVELARKNKSQLTDKKLIIKHQSWGKIIFLISIGLLGLFFGGIWTVNGAVFMAKQLGLSEFLISATIIAIGTSLPELATGIVAAKRNDTELAVGNAIGSNILNIFWILGITAIIAPVVIPSFINFDILLMGTVTLILFLSIFVGKKNGIGKWEGYFFVSLYIAYLAMLVIRG